MYSIVDKQIDVARYITTIFYSYTTWRTSALEITLKRISIRTYVKFKTYFIDYAVSNLVHRP